MLFLPGSLCENPGLRAAITDKGLESVGHSATTILKNALPTLTIPDITGKVKVKVAIKSTHIHYSVTNIKIDNLNIPGCSFTPSANGLTLSSLGNSVKITAHVKAKHKHSPHISASTDIRVDLSDVSFSTAFKLLRNPTNGHATLSTAACSSDVGNVHLSFHGSSSWVYKHFDHELKSEFKKNFHSAFCSKVTDELNNKGNKALESLPLLSKVENLPMLFNYTLTQDPSYTDSYMAVFLKGAFQPQNEQIPIPFTPAPFPPVNTNGRMLYVWLSDYILNSAGYALQQAGILQHTITPKLIPTMITSIFESYQSLYQLFPNMGVEIALKATKPPIVHLTPKGGEMSAFGSIDMNFILPYNTVVTAFTLDISAELDINSQIQSNGSITEFTANATLVSFKLINSSSIRKLLATPVLQFVLEYSVIPVLNKHGSKGLVIPTIDGMSFVNPELMFGENYGLVATDINYKMEMPK